MPRCLGYYSKLIEILFYFQPGMVRQRAPVSETLSRLHRDQLQKFAQYLITELPQQVLSGISNFAYFQIRVDRR